MPIADTDCRNSQGQLVDQLLRERRSILQGFADLTARENICKEASVKLCTERAQLHSRQNNLKDLEVAQTDLIGLMRVSDEEAIAKGLVVLHIPDASESTQQKIKDVIANNDTISRDMQAAEHLRTQAHLERTAEELSMKQKLQSLQAQVEDLGADKAALSQECKRLNEDASQKRGEQYRAEGEIQTLTYKNKELTEFKDKFIDRMMQGMPREEDRWHTWHDFCSDLKSLTIIKRSIHEDVLQIKDDFKTSRLYFDRLETRMSSLRKVREFIDDEATYDKLVKILSNPPLDNTPKQYVTRYETALESSINVIEEIDQKMRSNLAASDRTGGPSPTKRVRSSRAS